MVDRQSIPHPSQEQGSRVCLVALPDQLTWSAAEAAMMCGVSENTFRNWVNSGLMPQPLPRTRGRYAAYAVRRALVTIQADGIRTEDGAALLKQWEVEHG